MSLEKTLTEILIEEIAELYNLETRLAGLLPKMVEKASDADLRSAMTRHVRETEEHIGHLRRSIDLLAACPDQSIGRTAMLQIAEDDEWMEEGEAGHATDASLICFTHKIGNYKTAGYLNAAAFARLLELTEVAELLELSLKRSSGLMGHSGRQPDEFRSLPDEEVKMEAFL